MKKKLISWFIVSASIIVIGLGLSTHKQADGFTEDQTQIIQTIDRLSFGVTPGQIERVRSQGIDKYIESQLNPRSLSRSPQVIKYLASLDTLKRNPVNLYKEFQKYQSALRKGKKENLSSEQVTQLQRKRNQFKRKVFEQAREAHLISAIVSENQLQEVMVDFWFNHFNVFWNKKYIPFWLADYENTIREYSLGNFRDLLGATARHPAMLAYLDNELNTDPNSPGVRGAFKGINENYARELMELHTLGVDGGYTQKDVISLAKILTGWGTDPANRWQSDNGFKFYKKRHDFSDKVFLGKKIKGSGMQEVEQALDILASHPSTANFISYKLAQYFIADEPPKSLVKELAKEFTVSNGNIKQVLATLIESKEFKDPKYYEQKFKTPYQYLISMVRATGIKNPNLKRLEGMLGQLSMPTYANSTPDGYQNTKDVWLNPDAMLRRVGFATAISNGALNKKQRVNLKELEQTLGDSLSEDTKKVIAESANNLKAALILGSPEMMYK